MSLYNQLFGYNDLARVVLLALEVADPETLPRFRDAWFDAEGDRLVIYTRTGGANRADWAAGNDALRAKEGFQGDEDDDYDSTFAFWYYAIPEWTRETFDGLKAEGHGRDPLPAARWKAMHADMSSGADTPLARHALEVGRKILGPVLDDIDNPPPPGRVRIIRT